MTSSLAIDRWIDTAAMELDADTLEIVSGGSKFVVLEEAMAGARIVLLGETNHFVHEKADFRLWWLRRLAARHRLVIGEELSWFDAGLVRRFLDDGDEGHLDRMWTFGYTGNRRTDRDDSTKGILAASEHTYPTELFKAEQLRFYRELRALDGLAGLFGFDIGGHDLGYELLANRDLSAEPAALHEQLQRVAGESMEDEAARLERAVVCVRASSADLRSDLGAMIDSLRYTVLARSASSYEELRPAMAFREQAMKRRLADRLLALRDDEQLVLMAHAFHLAKDDRGIHGVGVGPGGDSVPSLGHHVAQELGLRPFSVWWLCGAGEDSQPFPDLPRQANYPADSLNARLARRGTPLLLGTTDLDGEVGVGHMYSQVVQVALNRQADAVFFHPRVSPLRGHPHVSLLRVHPHVSPLRGGG